MLEKYVAGAQCTVNTSHDMFMIGEARPFFDKPCVVIKRTKSGLILVALQQNLKHTFSFPQRNVDLI